MKRFAETTDYLIAGMPVGPFAMNQYVIVCGKTGDAAIVDSGGDPAPFLALVEGAGGTVRHLLQTHAHIDHIAGLEATKARVDAPIYLHPLDRPLLERSREQAQMFGLPPLNPPPADHELQEGQKITVGELEFEVLHTPGHAPGHVCFYAAGHAIMFGGDLLFRNSIGRTDLPGCDNTDMRDSLLRVAGLPEETRVFPGHMEDTTIGAEKRSNPFLAQLLR